jgi:hypothetical protein
MKKTTISLLAFFIGAITLTAQGFERLYNDNVINDFTQTTHQNFLMTGTYTEVYKSLGWIQKTDASGNPIWSHAFEVGDTATFCRAIQVIDTQHFVVAGTASFKTGPDYEKNFLRRYDGDGALVAEWISSQMVTPTFYAYASDLAQGTDGTLYFLANSSYWVNFNASKLTLLTPNLQEIAAVILSATLYQIEVLPNGDLMMCGVKNNLAYLCRTTPSGELLWEKTYQTGKARMTFTTDGNVVLATDKNLLKANVTNGDVVWNKTISLTNYAQTPTWVVEDDQQNLVVTGMYNANYTSVFTIHKLDSNGNLIWSKTPYQAMILHHSEVKPLITTTGSYALGGYLQNTANWDTDALLYVTDSNLSPVSTHENALKPLHAKAAPNPVSDRALLRWTETQTGRIRVWSNTGQCIREDQLAGTEYILETTNLPAGLYRVQLVTDQQRTTVLNIVVRH